MSEAKPDQPDRSGRRVYVLWGIGLGLLLFLGLFCWLFLGPYLQTRAAVEECAPLVVRNTQTQRQITIEAFANQQQAARRLSVYLRLPERLAPNRPTATRMLGLCGKAASEQLITLLGDRDAAVRIGATYLLAGTKDPRAVGPLIRALDDENHQVRAQAAESLGQIGDRRAVGPLLARLNDPDDFARRRIVQALGALHDPRAVEPLIKLIATERDESILTSAALALALMKDLRAGEPLIALFADKSRLADKPTTYCDGGGREVPTISSRSTVANALGLLKDPRALEPLIAALRDNDASSRAQAAWALGEIGDIRAIAPLSAALGDYETIVREAAQGAIGKLEKIESQLPPRLPVFSGSGR